MVYGPHWLPAGQPLTWLAMLAALQIFFQLTYDYVVLAMSRVVFTLQLVWMIVLVLVLVTGARIFGNTVVALGELAMAAAVPLPWYLFKLRKVGIGARSMAARLGLSLAGAAVAGLAAAGISAAAPGDLTAVACSAAAGSVVIGLLSVRGRSGSAGRRRRGDGLGGRDVAAHPALTAAPVASPGPAAPASVPRPDGRGAQTVIPARRPANPARLPLYEATVDVLRWDPAGHPDPCGLSGE